MGVLLRMIHDHAPLGVTITERNLVEEIDQVVTQTLVRSRDNADDRKRGVRRAIAAVFRRYVLKPVGGGSRMTLLSLHRSPLPG